MDDLDELKKIYKKHAIAKRDINNITSLEMLKVQFLIKKSGTVSQYPNGDISTVCDKKPYKITELGEWLYKYGLNK